ncbi:hypothetical protein CXF72_13385 [Psychromonas sp. MB-3u-54]|nr:hypothetical protein CXF72_13385 [Psychromonas sp. MB-3u-54]
MINKFKIFLSTPKGWLILTAVISLVYYLLTKHNQHFFEYLPFAILSIGRSTPSKSCEQKRVNLVGEYVNIMSCHAPVYAWRPS